MATVTFTAPTIEHTVNLSLSQREAKVLYAILSHVAVKNEAGEVSFDIFQALIAGRIIFSDDFIVSPSLMQGTFLEIEDRE